jgi:hypothetical protein
MNEVEYILRVILRARNEMGRVFANAAKQLDLFAAKAKEHDNTLKGFNTRIANMNTRIDASTEKIKTWQSAIRSFTGESEKADKATVKTTKSTGEHSKAVEHLATEIEKSGKKLEAYTKTQEELHRSSNRLGDSFLKLTKDIKSGERDRDDYVKDLKRVISEYDKLEKKTPFGSNQQKSFRVASNAARGLLKDLEDLTKEEDRRSAAEEKASKASLKGWATRRKNYAAEQAEAKVLATRIAAVTGEHERLNDQIKRGTISHHEHNAATKRLIDEYTKLSKAHDVGSRKARMFGFEAERLRGFLATLGRESRTTSTRVGGLNKSFSDGDRHAKHYAGSIAQLDNNLRGLGLLAAFAASQQLITGLVGLGGQFVSVASSAAMAGTAIGGMATAGVAQALPMLGLLGAALVRVKGVMDAVNQAQLLQKQNAVQGAKASRAQADGVDAVANAHDSLADAQDRASEATKRVTEAQREARRELQDMILAQKEATLAAKGAALSERDAQAALAQAIAEGGDVERAQLGVQEARLRRTGAEREARRGAVDTRRAVAGGVEGMPDVEAARKAAQEAAEGVAKAARGLETAKRNASEAVAGTLTAQAQLDYLLSQLSPAERRLYTAVTNFQKLFRTAYRGITDNIIDSFTHGVNRATEVLRMPQVIAEARKLSKEIGKSFTGIFDAFSSKPMVEQFLRITEAGRKNLPTVTDIVIDLGKSFANIAEAGGPALSKFLGFISNLVDDFKDLTGQRGALTDFFLEGETHLEAWVKLGISIINFFAALSGAGGADAGLKSVEDATGAIDDLTQKIKDNADDVRKFFEDSREVTDDIIRVVVALGEELFKAFSPEHIHGLADFLIDTLIPALGDVVKVVSTVSDIFFAIASIPGFGDAIKLLIEIAAFSMVAGSAAGGMKRIGDQMLYMADGAKAIRTGFLKVGPAIEGFGSKMTTAGTTAAGSLGPVSGRLGRLAPVFTRLGPVITRFGAVARIALATAFGPWGLAVAAVITGIILLDKKFHFLGATFKWLKGAISDVFDWLKHHWPLVLAIMTLPILPITIALTLLVKHFGAVRRAVTSAFRTVKHIVGDVADWVMDKLRWLGRTIVGFLPGRFRKAGRDAANGLWDGIKSIGRFFANIGTWLFNHVIKPIYNFFEIKSPSGYFKRIGRMLVDGLVDGFKNLPHAMLNALKGMGNLLMDVGKKVGEWLRKGIEKIPGGKFLLSGLDKARGLLPFAEGGPVPGSGSGDVVPAMLTPGEHVWTAAEVQAAGGHGALFAMRAFYGGGTQSSGIGMANGGYPVPRLLGQSGLQDPQSPAIEKDRQQIKRSGEQRAKDWRTMWNDMVATARRGANDIEKQLRDMRVNGTNTLRRLRRDWSKVWGDAWQNVADFTYTALQYAGHETNLALHAFGAKTLNFGLRSKDIKGGKAEGGWIGSPGERGRDRVPTWLGRGEAVLNWAHQRYIAPAVEAYYGHPFEKTFDRVHGFHAGGAGDAVGYAQGGLTGPAGSGAAFTAIANFAKQKFGLSMTAGRTNHGVNTSTGNVSDHSWGGAGDFSNGTNTPQENAFNTFWKTKAPQAVKQLIWQGKDQFRGFPISDHFDHVHLAVNRALAFDLPRMAKIISRASRGLDIRELMAGVTDTEGAPIVDHVDKLSIEGVPWARTLLKKLTDKVVNAANTFIDSKAATVVPSSDAASVPLSPGGSAEKVFNYFVDRGLSEVVAAGIAGAFQKESNFSTSVTNRLGSGATGLAQWLGDRLTGLRAFGGDHWNTLQTQLDYVWHELTTSESGALAGTKKAKTPEEAATLFDRLYERSDGLLNAPRYARAIFNAFEQHRPHFAEGGIVGGGDGTPVPIVAHAGEWVLNRGQQAYTAALAGLSREGLRSMLGFSGGGKLGYADGGELPTTALHSPLQGVKLADIVDKQLRTVFVLLRRMTEKMATSLKTGEVGTFTNRLDRVMDGLKDASVRLDRVGRKDRRKGIDAFLKTTDALVGDQGLFAKLRTAIETRAARAQTRLLRARFALGGGGVVTRAQDDVQEAAASRDELRRLQPELETEQDLASRALRRVRQQQKRGGLTRDERQRLAGRAAELQTGLDEANQRVAENISAIYDAQEAYADAQRELAEKLKEQQQKWADAIEKTLTVTTAGLDRAGRVLDATGVVGQTVAGAGGVSRAGIFAARGSAQQTALSANIALRDQVAALGNNSDLVDELNEKIAELQVAIVENTAAAFEAKVQSLESSTGYALTMNDLNKQILELSGEINNNTDQTALLTNANDRATILANKGIALQQLWEEARDAGNQQKMDELAQAMLENTVASLQQKKAIDELTGTMKEPQTFTSSAWTQFREAIFTGMGQVLPQYDVGIPSMQGGGHVIRGGLFKLHAGETVHSNSTTKGDQNFNFEINEAGGPVDLTALSSTVAFAAKTAQ